MKNYEDAEETISTRRPELRFNGPGAVQMNEPPTVKARLAQLRETLATMERHAAALQCEIFGNHVGPDKPVEIVTFEDQLADAGTRMACLCGFLATINHRFGVGSAPKSGAGQCSNQNFA
jgi:hypothetical protein